MSFTESPTASAINQNKWLRKENDRLKKRVAELEKNDRDAVQMFAAMLYSFAGSKPVHFDMRLLQSRYTLTTRLNRETQSMTLHAQHEQLELPLWP